MKRSLLVVQVKSGFKRKGEHKLCRELRVGIITPRERSKGVGRYGIDGKKERKS